MVLPVGTEMAVHHQVEPHRQVAVAEGRQATLVTLQEALVHPEALPEVVVMVMAMIVEMVTFQNERVRVRRNQMVKVLKAKRKKMTKK